jgi:hypothetical protein
MESELTFLPTAEEVLMDKASDEYSALRRLVICSIFKDERPIKGQAGMLDWKLCGFLSRFLIRGKISGDRNEFVYVPIRSSGVELKHLLLVGLGTRADQEDSTAYPTLLKNLVKTVENLKFTEVAISKSSFPFWTELKMKSVFTQATAIKVEFTQ